MNVKLNNDQPTAIVPEGSRYGFSLSALDDNQLHNAIIGVHTEGPEERSWTGTDNTYWSGIDYIWPENGLSDTSTVIVGSSQNQSSYPPLLVDHLRGRGLIHHQGDNDFEMHITEFSNLSLLPAPAANTSDGIYSKFQQLLNSYRNDFMRLPDWINRYLAQPTSRSNNTQSSNGESYLSSLSNARSDLIQLLKDRSNFTRLSSSRSDYTSMQTFGAVQGFPSSYDAVGDDAVIVPFTLFYYVPEKTKDEAPDPSVLPAPNSPAASGLPVISVPLSPASSAASSSATLSLGVLHEHEERSSIDSEELPNAQDEQAPQEPIPPVNSGASSTPAPDAPTDAPSHIPESSADAGSCPVTSVSVAFPHPVLQVPRVIVEAPPSGAVQMLAQASTLFLVPASPGKLSRPLASSLATSFIIQELQLPDDISDRSEKRKRRSFSLREKMGLKL